jgi:hypothetical protein
VAQDQDLHRLDTLLAVLGGRNRGPCDLLMEHIEAARRYLLGSMPGEYIVSLEQALASVSCIADKRRRSELKTALRSAIDLRGAGRGDQGPPV